MVTGDFMDRSAHNEQNKLIRIYYYAEQIDMTYCIR